MTLPRLSLLARKIHRFLVLIIIALGLPMPVTGTVMKFPGLLPLDPFSARRLHGTLSSLFGPVFFVMALTGFLLYSYPWIVRRMRKPSPPTTS